MPRGAAAGIRWVSGERDDADRARPAKRLPVGRVRERADVAVAQPVADRDGRMEAGRPRHKAEQLRRRLAVGDVDGADPLPAAVPPDVERERDPEAARAAKLEQVEPDLPA